MSTSLCLRRLLPAFVLLLCTGGAWAQETAAAPFQPEVGQDGKDVIWVPTAESLVEKMLDMAKVTPRDYVVDLGSGDGRTVIAAAKRGARALGVEFNPDMVGLSRRNAAAAGVGDRARFVEGDIFKSDFSQATVIALFLLPELNVQLRPKILAMKPGTRVVSNSFDMGDWQADRTIGAPGECDTYCRAYLWIVPAQVQGIWRMSEGELKLGQTYQLVSGTVKAGSRLSPIVNGRINGDEISFVAGRVQYTGRVNGNAIEGSLSGARTGKWRATRG